MGKYVLEAIGITKVFPGVLANDNVNLSAMKGEVLGLIGENGAGKSTLLKILNGVYPAGTYKGVLKIDGEEVRPTDPNHALNLGISFVPQEISVLSNMSVAENMFIGDLTLGQKGNLVNRTKMNQKAQSVLEENRIALDINADVRKLSVGQQQLLMIAKALSVNPKILILDEPTTSLSSADVERLFQVVLSLKEKGTCIIFVTHKMEEILQLTDRVCVLRDGKNVGLFCREEYDKDKIIEAMIGRQISTMYPERDVKIGELLLDVKNLSVDHPYIAGRKLIRNISFQVHRGEVVGIAGLVGAGRSEVVQSIFGMMGKTAGTMTLNGKKLSIHSPADAMKNGIALVTEDRKKFGLVHIWSIMKNITLSNLKEMSLAQVLISKKTEQIRAKKYFDYLRIKAPSMRTRVDTLSGGNQQKVVIARSLNSEPELVMLDEPTKGIDVGAKYEIYNFINEMAAQGKGQIMISSELPELMAMCDRFIVMAEGQIVGEVSKEEASTAKIMEYAVTTFKKRGEVHERASE